MTFPPQGKIYSKPFFPEKIKTEGFPNGDSFELLKLGVFVPVDFGTRLGVSLAAPKGVSQRMAFKMASLLFELLIL